MCNGQETDFADETDQDGFVERSHSLTLHDSSSVIVGRAYSPELQQRDLDMLSDIQLLVLQAYAQKKD